ncbi:BamA/TamA family outer membrane protein [Emticicia sp. 21SJ11W-3]|uniref:translocation and assembly module lipoprotein TamL n=1 Tax=Emticicia sp. 21SJ11W-3 TaxID=2916755 RepID=UPI0020A2284F|nr:BamA/TamA family outer membrane protein [Emticicia sp. 21SJ11W-3]UTA69759.1 outer membrane protein assembly factor [Emticicia sp. 21SJ11W-3]
MRFNYFSSGHTPDKKKPGIVLSDKIKFLPLLFLIFTACSRKVQLAPDEYRLHSLTIKGNKQIPTEELEYLIPPAQKPNRRPFNLPVTPYVGLYNFGKNFYSQQKIKARRDRWDSKLKALPSPVNFDAEIEKKRKRYQKKVAVYQDRLDTGENWWMKNVGEPPAKITEAAIKHTSDNIQKYIYNKGFFDNTVVYDIDSAASKRGIKLTYHVEEKNAYYIDTVNYAIEDPRIDSILRLNTNARLIKSGQRLDMNNITLEKARIELTLKDEGYYNFVAKNSIAAEIDTTDYIKRNYRVNVKMLVSNPPFRSRHEQFRIESVYFVSADPSGEAISKGDTTRVSYNNIDYSFIGKRFPSRLLDKKILIRQGQLFRISKVNETNRQLYGLDQFAFANIRFTQLPDNKLRTEIIAPTNPKYTASYNFDVNNINGILGGGANVSLRARNLLSALETTELGLRANLEGQPGLDTTVQRSRELGANLAFNFPKIIFLNKVANLLSLKSPRTQVALSYNNSSQQLYRRQVFRLTGNYSWLKSKYETIQISPFDINLINTPYKSRAFDSILTSEALRGNNLKVLFDPQFVSSISGSYIYNNQVQGKNIRAKFLRIFVESGGTAINFFPDKNKIRFIDRLFPIDTNQRAYFRFVKINIDFRRYIPINSRDSWAYRFNVGVAHPYGDNQALPFEKNFFIGGPNSIRAWRPRALGPGSAQGVTVGNRFFQQPGDILMEGSLEYRKFMFRFIGNWNAGFFIDAGNVWKWYQINSKFNEANFNWGRFYKEFAVGTGAGIRLDLDYFIARFDWGVKVIDPSRKEGDRFVLDKTRLGRSNEYYPVFHFAIGYPF